MNKDLNRSIVHKHKKQTSQPSVDMLSTQIRTAPYSFYIPALSEEKPAALGQSVHPVVGLRVVL